MALTFNYLGQPIRVVKIDGRPWFVAADFYPVLFKTGGGAYLKKLAQEEVRAFDSSELKALDLPAARRLILISEAGLFALIKMANTGKGEALENWLNQEVLPIAHGMKPQRLPASPIHPKAHLLVKHIEIGNRKATPKDLEDPPFEHMIWTGARKPSSPYGKMRMITDEYGTRGVVEFPKPTTGIGGKHIHPVKLIMGCEPYTRVKNMCGHLLCVNPTHYRAEVAYLDHFTTQFTSERAKEKTLRVTNTPLREALINNERPWNKKDKEIIKFIDELEYQGLSITIYGNRAIIRE